MEITVESETTITSQKEPVAHCEKNLGALASPIQTEVKYLVRDPKHETEKPYELHYPAGDNFPETNLIHESRSVDIHDFRSLASPQSFEEYGFSLEQFKCSLAAADFEDKDKVKKEFYPAVEKILHQAFSGAAKVRILEHGIRKRHTRFPRLDDAIVESIQPATAVHIDFSPQSASRMALAAFKIGPDEYRRLLTINFWKSLQGRGNDWPLAICDWRSIDYAKDTIPSDVVFADRFNENERVYYSADHCWYYVKDLGDEEVLMLRQTDSDLKGGGGVPHASFHNPKADVDAAPRISIELRAFVFFD